MDFAPKEEILSALQVRRHLLAQNWELCACLIHHPVALVYRLPKNRFENVM
jgi:hypothetical protein